MIGLCFKFAISSFMIVLYHTSHDLEFQFILNYKNDLMSIINTLVTLSNYVRKGMRSSVFNCTIQSSLIRGVTDMWPAKYLIP
jgi:hypothetical protein